MQHTNRFSLALILIITLFTFSNFVAAQDRELTGPDQPGFHRFAWDLRAAPPDSPQQGQRGRTRAAEVDPGPYTVKLTTRNQEFTQTVTVKPDPRK